MEKKKKRVYIPVMAYFRSDGEILPRSLTWTDGTSYKIDRVKAITQAPALWSGGQGDRYTVIINGLERYLYFERNASISGNNIGRWFVEA